VYTLVKKQAMVSRGQKQQDWNVFMPLLAEKKQFVLLKREYIVPPTGSVPSCSGGKRR
jgi:hypothetical protein